MVGTLGLHRYGHLRQVVPYQRIVLTRNGADLRLHLNGNLQFSSRDEYRYHEALVHPGLARLHTARSVLVLGAVMDWQSVKSSGIPTCKKSRW